LLADRGNAMLRPRVFMRLTRRSTRALRRAALALLVPGLIATASAQQAGPAAEGQDPPVVIREKGEYSGVKPGDSPYKAPAKPRNLVSWIGYQPLQGGASRVFVQLTNEVPYSQRVENNVLIVKLDGVRYRNRNVSRRLDMRFFDSALRQVISKRVFKQRARKNRPAQTPGIELRIHFKTPADAAQATATMRAAKDGYHYLLLDFAAPAA
jgi:hypothetical protein